MLACSHSLTHLLSKVGGNIREGIRGEAIRPTGSVDGCLAGNRKSKTLS